MTFKATIRNRSAAFLWGFTSVWMAMLIAMTWVLHRDGAPAGYSTSLVMAVLGAFWLAGAALVWFAISNPCLVISIDTQGVVHAAWRYPHRVVRRSFVSADLTPARVVDDKDSEGDPYFFARSETVDGRYSLNLAESHDRSHCERVCTTFSELIVARL